MKKGRDIKKKLPQSVEEVNEKLGDAAVKAGKKIKSVKEKTSEAGKKVSGAAKWIKENPKKSAAVGAGAVIALANSEDDTDALVEEIKKKSPSERTPAEKRLLRIMEE